MVFLPDTALLVPGAAGRADPAAGLRRAALDALAGAFGQDAPDGRTDGRVLVVAPARRDRFLSHPVAPGLGAAGLDPALLDLDPPIAAPRADVPASVALVLLRAAGVRAAVDVQEIDRTAAPAEPAARPVPRTPYADALAGIVVVGSLSARHGPDAPSPDDPRALAVDAALLAALAAGPDALAAALDDLGPEGARDLAVSGGVPWRVALGHLGPRVAVTVTVHHGEVLAGAQHAVVAWSAPAPAPAPDPAPPAPPEEPR